jgi:hypothetical protein|tara:strand:+ start:1253 stop:1477 length:225 start_codon:yes stop_codon:yes gene_type:complete
VKAIIDRGGRACLEAGATRDAGRVTEWGKIIGNDSALKTSLSHAENKCPLNFIAGPDAAGAVDAFIGVKPEIGV